MEQASVYIRMNLGDLVKLPDDIARANFLSSDGVLLPVEPISPINKSYSFARYDVDNYAFEPFCFLEIGPDAIIPAVRLVCPIILCDEDSLPPRNSAELYIFTKRKTFNQ